MYRFISVLFLISCSMWAKIDGMELEITIQQTNPNETSSQQKQLLPKKLAKKKIIEKIIEPQEISAVPLSGHRLIIDIQDNQIILTITGHQSFNFIKSNSTIKDALNTQKTKFEQDIKHKYADDMNIDEERLIILLGDCMVKIDDNMLTLIKLEESTFNKALKGLGKVKSVIFQFLGIAKFSTRVDVKKIEISRAWTQLHVEQIKVKIHSLNNGDKESKSFTAQDLYCEFYFSDPYRIGSDTCFLVTSAHYLGIGGIFDKIINSRLWKNLYFLTYSFWSVVGNVLFWLDFAGLRFFDKILSAINVTAHSSASNDDTATAVAVLNSKMSEISALIKKIALNPCNASLDNITQINGTRILEARGLDISNMVMEMYQNVQSTLGKDPKDSIITFYHYMMFIAASSVILMTIFIKHHYQNRSFGKVIKEIDDVLKVFR